MYPRKIYEITHRPTGRVYVGSSHDPEGRIMSHLSALRRGKHPVEDMQADFDQHGWDYSFSIIGEIRDETEDHKEYACMLERRSNERGYGYNYKDKKCPKRSARSRSPAKAATTSERLQKIMAERQIKQVDLVRETGIDKGSISHYVSGRYEPKQEYVHKLAAALGVSAMWLSGYDVPMTPIPQMTRECPDDERTLIHEMGDTTAHELLALVRDHENPEWALRVATVVLLQVNLQRELEALAEMKAR